jgi:hypothetical protein
MGFLTICVVLVANGHRWLSRYTWLLVGLLVIAYVIFFFTCIRLQPQPGENRVFSTVCRRMDRDVAVPFGTSARHAAGCRALCVEFRFRGRVPRKGLQRPAQPLPFSLPFSALRAFTYRR